MPTVYWDPVSGNDANDGLSKEAPKLNLHGATGASATATANNEVRCKGLQWTAKGNATWTQDSTSVVFVADAALAGGEYLYPDGATEAVPYEVASYVAGTKTATLRNAWRGATGSYSTPVINTLAIATAQTMTSGAAGQKLTFGWDFVTGTQPSDFTSMMVLSSAVVLAISQYNTWLVADGPRLVCGQPYTSGYRCLNLGANCRVTGTLMIVNSNFDITGNDVEIDELRAAIHNAGTYAIGENVGNLRLRVRKIIAHNCDRTLYAPDYGHRITIGEMIERWCTRSIYMEGGQDVMVGSLYIRGNGRGGGTTPPTVYSGRTSALLRIGYLDTNQSLVPAGNVYVGGPVASWRYSTYSSVVTKTAGRGGSGYGFKIDPSAASQPYGTFAGALPPLSRPVAAGQAVTLKFWAVYTGTLADPPPCFVRLLEPNGLTVEDIAFTPARSANTPGGTPDGWTDATQQTITFTGTTTQAGSIQFGIFCRDNAAGDAVLYIDDISWVVV